MTALAGCSLLDPDEHDDRGEPDRGRDPVSREPARGDATRAVPDRLASRYGSAVNVVAAGVDHTGAADVTDAVRSLAEPDTALYFPRGTYRIDETLRIGTVSDLALVGDGALLRPPSGFADTLVGLGTDGGGTGVRVEGIDVDLTADRTGARPFHVAVEDELLVRDVTVYGRQDVDHDCVRFDVTDADGAGRIERLRLPDGGVTEYPITGIYVGERSAGELTFADCEVAGFPDNGLYASPAEGPVRVVGGHYRNNGIANVRVSGDSVVRDLRVTCDSTRDGLENMRGIRLRNGGNVRVENVEVEIRSVTESDGAITMAEWLDGAVIANTTIRTDADGVPAIVGKRPTDESSGTGAGPDASRVELTDVRIRGSAAGDAAIVVLGRDRCRFDGVCIHQSGEDRDGIHLSNSSGNRLRNSFVTVGGDALVLENATARRTRVFTGFGVIGPPCG